MFVLFWSEMIKGVCAFSEYLLWNLLFLLINTRRRFDVSLGYLGVFKSKGVEFQVKFIWSSILFIMFHLCFI